MTKMSQCSTCIGDGVHCEHYRPTDDSPCPNYIFDTSSTEQGTIKYEVKKALYRYIALIVIVLILLSFIGAVTFWDYVSIIPYLSFLVFLYLVIAHFDRILQLVKEKFWNRKIKHHETKNIEFATGKKQKQSSHSEISEIVDTVMNTSNNRTRDLVINTLKEIGCQPEVDDDKDICFKYQNEDFFIDANNRTAFIIIWSNFGSLSLNDPDINILKDAINQTNMDGRVTLAYFINNEENTITVYCKHYLPFVHEIPSIQEYLRSNLDNFFWTHQYLEDKFNTLKENPIMQSSRERIIIKGFNTKRDDA